ncbi:uncharacterized protein LOC141834629 isoform X2 [Curcuma longa]|uniref:uncharacterized protein LOC141834629 isoform X2 n=1 Tax=Curcuma longa TaxID=136217 RepID=UPI003D9F86EE
MNQGLLRLLFALCFLFSSAVPQFNDNKPGIPTTDDTNRKVLSVIQEKWGIQIWDDAFDPCDPGAWWTLENVNPRVVCDCSANCTVTLLKISGKNISREIPVDLFDLTNLTTLDLSRNILNGSIPPQIGRLKQLQNLSLDTNNLTGSIPPDIGNLTKLRNLSLSTNRLSGDIPPEFGELISLEQLYIDSNELTGSLQFGTHVASQNNMTELKILWAFDNNFTGPLPETIGRFTNLKDLRIFGTSFEGPIPQQYSALTNLETLRLGDLKDHSSSLFFLEKMTNLSFLSLRNCLVDHSIPDFFQMVQNFSSLTFLDLSHNKLKGSIPKYLKNLTSLQYLFLGYNSLTGTVPLELLPESLTTLDISFNNLSGVPPEKPNCSLNYIGNFMDVNNTSNRARNMLHCLQENSSCAWNTFPSSFLAINCGGLNLTSGRIIFDEDAEPLGRAGFDINQDHYWVVMNAASTNLGYNDIVTTDYSALNTPENQVYLTARTSTGSLRYFMVGLSNGNYTVVLYFAEIVMDDNSSPWAVLGRRIFDISIQSELRIQNFNIMDDAKEYKTPVSKAFNVTIINGVLDIHLFWAGKGTCCIPVEGTYGPLLSAIRISPVVHSPVESEPGHSTRRRAGVIVGFAAIGTATVIILISIAFLWLERIEIARKIAQTTNQ